MPDPATPVLLRHARNDLAGHRGVNAALFAILVLAAFLLATGAAVIERLVGSIDQLFEQARPPHFLQMHTGEYDADALAGFAAARPGIEAWTVVELYGFDGAAIGWQRPATGESGDLSASLIDNLFVTQNADFDFLLDESGAIARPAPGEVYLPVAYQQRFGLRAADELSVGPGERRLRVAGFVRDAQMASSLSSATRFLVAPVDLRALGAAGGGAAEIIVEYRLADPSAAARLQSEYEADETLPRNGQAVTGEMIRLVNAFSDGLVAMALIFAGAVLIAIALVNVRFVIRGSLHDRVREIGAMRAIGLPHRQVARLYLATYSVLTLAACLVGGLLSPVAVGALTAGLRADYAAAASGIGAVLAPAGALAAMCLAVLAICAGVLRGVRRIEVVDALVHGSIPGRRRRARRDPRGVREGWLESARGASVNRRLALSELRVEWREWLPLPIVFLLATVMMVLPMNLLSTFESPRFVSYLGAPESDLRADLRFAGDLDATRAALLDRMRADDRLSSVRGYADVLAVVDGADGPATLRVEVGDYSGGTVAFVGGGPPVGAEIALSVLNAQRHGVGVGDRLRLRLDGDWAGYRVSGIYADVTSGGHTAKIPGEVTEGAAGYVIYADVVDGADPTALASEYGARFAPATVIPMREYLRQTLEHVTGVLRLAAGLTFGAGLGVAWLLTGLVLGLQLARHRRRMGVLAAIGFSAGEIAGQLRGKALLMVLAGTAAGLLVSATLGDAVAGWLIGIAGLGLAELSVIAVPWLVFGLYPLALIGAGWLSAALITARLRRADPGRWLD